MKSWDDIVESYRHHADSSHEAAFAGAIRGLLALSQSIRKSPDHAGLHGWMSMLDLCIQQTQAAPYSGPYLRVSPLQSGDVEFSFIDTMIKSRQWRRSVIAARTVEQFDQFAKQLRWQN